MDYWGGGQRICWPSLKLLGGRGWPPGPLFLRLCEYTIFNTIRCPEWLTNQHPEMSMFFLSKMTSIARFKLSTLNGFDTDQQTIADQCLPSLFQAHMQQYL